MPDVPDQMVKDSCDSTVVELTSTPAEAPSTWVELPDHATARGYLVKFKCDRALIEETLRRSTSELFEKTCFDEEIFAPFVPSGSANYMRSREDGGSIGYLYDAGILGKNPDLLNTGVTNVEFGEPVSAKYGEAGAREQEWIAQFQQMGYDQPVDGVVNIIDDEELKQVWKDQYIDLFENAMTESPEVEVVGLVEPLKVRVISKGPPMTYTVLKPFQKWLWGVLKKNRVFDLIGRYVQEEDINITIGELLEHEEVVSGDYVSSTNKLHSWVSETICDQLFIEIGECIPREFLNELPKNFLSNLKVLFMRALTKHVFVHNGEKLDQKEGQLMGSIISFPFLCIANAALCRLSLEISEGKSFRIRDKPFPHCGKIAPVKINGDDCVLKGSQGRLRPTWEVCTMTAGLSSSVGKTYFSRAFCTINSTLYEWKGALGWIEQKYINLGLMCGRKRYRLICGATVIGKVEIHNLGNTSRELKRSCPPEMWPVVKKRFIYHNMDTLKSCPGLPWFIPEWLGGVGLPMDNPQEIGELDRRCATVIKSRYYSKEKGRKLYQPVRVPAMAEWCMHNLIQRELNLVETPFRTVTLNGVKTLLEDEYNRAYRVLVCNLLQKTESLEGLREVIDSLDQEKSTRKALRHNVDVWSRARKCAFDYEPMSDSDLAYENKNLSLPVMVRSIHSLLP